MRIKLYNFIAFIVFSAMFLPYLALAKGDTLPNRFIRVYCAYKPTNNPSATDYKKLLNENGTDSYTIKAVFNNKDKVYNITPKDYYDLYNKCEKLVASEGQMIRQLLATDYSYRELFTNFYKLSTEYAEFEKLNAKEKNELLSLLSLDDEEVLNEIGLNKDDANDLRKVLIENKAAIKQIAESPSSIGNIINDAIHDPVTAKVLTAAAFLATAWLSGPYVAYGVDLIYPMAYEAITGQALASMGLVQYYTVYIPSKYRAVVWAYNNSHIITATAGVGLKAIYDVSAGLINAGKKLFSKKVAVKAK